MIKFVSTTAFITSHVRSAGYPANEIIETMGYSSSGSVGGSKWKATGSTIAVSQTPLLLNTTKLSDASGNEFDLVLEESGIIDLNVLGGTSAAFVNIANAAGLTYSQGLTSDVSVDIKAQDTLSTMINTGGVSAGEAFNVKERIVGNGGGGLWDAVVTGTTPGVDLPNTANIVVGVSNPLISFVLRVGNQVNIREFGAVDNIATDSTIPMTIAYAYAQDNKVPILMPNGKYAVSTTITIYNRITVNGQNKEDTQIVWIGGASTIMHINNLFVGNNDPEESLFTGFTIINRGTATVGFQIDASYTTLKEVRVYVGASDTKFSTAALQTLKSGLPQSNTNQLSLLNCEIRGDKSLASGGNGPIGAWIVGGANIRIEGGYYGVFDEAALKLGFRDAVNAKEHSAENVYVGGGLVMEQNPTFSASTSVCCVVEAASSLTFETCRIEFGGPGGTLQRGIFSNGRWNGGAIQGCTFAGTSAATGAIDFDLFAAPATQNADGVYIHGNQWVTVGSAGTFPINLLNLARPNLIIGSNNHTFGGTANKDDIDILLIDGDTTPNVAPGNLFKTQNTTATTISDLDGVQREMSKTVNVIFGDDNTEVDFVGGSLRGNRGINWVPKTNDNMICTQNQTLWFCVISGNVEPFQLTANLVDINNSINTQGKFLGKAVYNGNTNKAIWAAGATAASTWNDAQGVVQHTPV